MTKMTSICLIILGLAGAMALRKSYFDSWQNFKRNHPIPVTPKDEQTRFKNYLRTLEDIDNFNKIKDSIGATYEMGTNIFSDMCNDDRDKIIRSLKNFTFVRNCENSKIALLAHERNLRRLSRSQSRSNALDIPETVSWRSAVNPVVYYQGSCAACWAIASTEALESYYYLATGNMTSLSPQNVMDCSWSYGNSGCEGGNPYEAYAYMQANGNINLASCYPFTLMDSYVCRYNSSEACFGAGNVTGIGQVAYGDENAMKIAIAKVGPMSVVVNSLPQSFQNYKSGIYNDPTCTADQETHVMLLLGYGTENGTDYWLLKSSWGTFWGIQGYMKMIRNVNMCNIGYQAAYPILTVASPSTTTSKRHAKSKKTAERQAKSKKTPKPYVKSITTPYPNVIDSSSFYTTPYPIVTSTSPISTTP